MSEVMSVREFAGRVLFATTLEEKLARPPTAVVWEDGDPGAALSGSPDLPGRPTDLVPHARAEARARFPGDTGLVDDRRRATLLHFFANHELLAVELMALALLKFPDAPKAFRRGVLHTLQEEQLHTRWYCRRMEECGVRFGEMSVSRMIWDHIAPMESPLEFVSRLSLTFEQANLDFAKHYSQVLGDAGDPRSAAILNRIYHDEIAHVGHGLKWLRRWKEEKESDWEAWRRSLRFPLSPVRARGNVPFNAEGRRLAGLDESFIENVRLYRRTRGRAPDVWFFNPAAEEEWSARQAGRPWHEPARLRELAADFETAFACIAGDDDVALLRREPSTAHRRMLLDHGIALPAVILLDGNGRINADETGGKVRNFRPWADSPCAESLAQSLPGFAGRQPPPDPEIFCKASFVRWMADRPELHFDAAPRARVVFDASEWGAAITEIREAGYREAVVKPSFGSAGRGQIILDSTTATLPAAVARALASGPVIVEPRLHRLIDFSLQFDVAATRTRFLGPVLQECDARGVWRASIARTKFASALDPKSAAYLMSFCLPQVDATLLPALHEWCAARRYEGPLGIDSILYRAPDGGIAWRALVDPNPRWTMGRLAMHLRNHIHPTRAAALENHPVRAFHPEPATLRDGRLWHGAIPLTDPAAARHRVLVLRAL